MAVMTVAAPRSVRSLVLVAGVAAALVGCTFPGRPGTTTTRPPTTAPATTVRPPTTAPPTTAPPTGAVTPPPANGGFDYQIGAAYPPIAGVKIVTRPHEQRSPVAGLYNVCYINGFQAQSEDESWWLTNHRDLVLHSGGVPVKDDGWDELLLDTSTAAKREGLAAVVGGWIAECRTAGFQAVEIDNLDSYGRSGGRLTQSQAVAYLRLLANRAHGLGLAIAQKNSPELAGRRSELGTDFAVVEDCNRYDECDAFTAAYGDRVLVVEYQRSAFTKGCARWPQLSIVFRDMAVRTRTTAADIC
jgi:hypothetical protein